MPENRVSATLSPEALNEIKADLAKIREKLPFLVALTSEASKSLTRIGDKSRAFVSNYAKASQMEGDLEPLLEDLGKRFRKSRRKTEG